jgi:starch-binding outer membrane protein, SusD/RagB family
MKRTTTTPYFFSPALLLAMLCLLASCKKFVTVPPPETALTGNTVFTDDKTATAAINGIYSRMMQSGYLCGSRSITILDGLAADEFNDNYDDESQTEFYRNELEEQNGAVKGFWTEPYSYIYSANSILEGLAKPGNLSVAVKAQLEGEAKFVRALNYFYLVNLFGDVPLVLTTSYQENATLKRTAQVTVYEQIVADLQDAETLMSDTYPAAPARIRPNKSATSALLARVYLYLKVWDKAEAEATKVINNPVYVLDTNLDNVFINSSVEAIWQLRPVLTGWGVFDAYELRVSASSGPGRVSVTDNLSALFETGDARKSKWLTPIVYNGKTYYQPFKYRQRFTSGTNAVPNEFFVVFRLAEQYIIRAEARLKQGKLTGANSAETDINAIRTRAGLANTTASTETTLLDAIIKERRTELFAEMGHRWFDLKRWKMADAVIGTIKPTTWQPTDTLCPVPQYEMRTNPSMQQNAGY